MQHIISFLSDLKKNNNREWFSAHKDQYQRALEEFRELTVSLHAGICSFDPSLMATDPLDSIFRIYKDVRFSKDKSPYKTHFGCWLTRGGRKFNDAGYYFHLEPGEAFMAAGVHSPPADLLRLIRQEILFNPDPYLDLCRKLDEQDFVRGGTEDMLKKGPAGFPKDFPHLDLLKYKHHVFSKNYPDKVLKRADFLQVITADFKGLQPLVAYLNEAMSFSGNE